MSEPHRTGSLWARLALVFVLVAVTAVAALAAVILLTTRNETNKLSATDRATTANDAARALADAYRRTGSWATADLAPAQVVVRDADAVLSLRSADGRTVIAGPVQARGSGHGSGPVVLTRAVSVDGHIVGFADVRFPGRLSRTQSVLRDKLFGAVLLGSALAVAIALLGAALVARTVTVPLHRVVAAARRLQAGDLGARAEAHDAPGELGELSRTFDGMAHTLERERSSRRRMISDLAHEVRTPIAILRGNLEELVDEVAQPTPKRLASLHEEVLRLSALVEDLDALAHADVPVAVIDHAPVELAALTRAQIEALRPRLDAKALRLDERLAVATVTGDRTRLGQLVANLLGNAIKFTPAGGRIEVVIDAPDGSARLSVADNGPGVPHEERDRVFERFWRGSSARGISGRGIGLAVAAEIVRAHGGEIEVADTDGGGARFVVTLPAP
jgi:two-component system sensor histidine kinase BaeS